ncbi:GDYXXLXY domain-containing protein [Campylobacter sp.]|uniref:GDYXXLXY domain-containing protein n=1 Tax=Campylobacter sp. TaxID=205 RepID=UPI0027118B58|nr:GDYXXLXY domain-containing protein [Campylobacter sp.]
MKFKLVIAAIIFQILALFGMLGYAYAPIYFGKDIKVDVSLYDPRDFLRGNYVSLNYDFSRIEEESFDRNLKGNKIYAVLKEDENGFYKFQGHSFTKPESGTFLAGRIPSYRDSAIFGVEAFFLPVKKALDMERAIRQNGAFAVISVMDNGRARVKSIFIKPSIPNINVKDIEN